MILLLPLTARAQTAPPAGVPPLSTLLAGSIYEPWGALAGAAFGNGAAGGTETLAYGSRDRLSSLTTTGADASATGSTNLSGSEQVKKGAAPTQASGAVKIYGDEQSVQVAAQAGTGSVGIGGAEFEFQMCGPPGRYSGVLKPACREVWASGTVSITVQGQAFSAGYGQGSTSASLAAALAAAVNSGSRYATAVAAGGEVHLTARTTGSATDYSLSAAATSSDSSERAAFSAAASGAAFTGGRSASTYYDAGTVEITINGQEITASFGQGSTSASVAA
ncbi:MAG: hypothetical protein ACRD13_05050, partial [Terriglobales bacterium]